MVGMLITFAAVWHFSSMAPLPRHSLALVACLIDVATYMVYWADGDWSMQGARKAVACWQESVMTMLMSALAVLEFFRMLILPSPDDAPQEFSFFFWTQVGLLSGLLLCLVTMIFVVTYIKPYNSATH
jgi:hypothetical protein